MSTEPPDSSGPTVVVLLYGNHPDLAARCLEPVSVWHRSGSADVRILCNDVSQATIDVIDCLGLLDAVEGYATGRAKYPAMRDLLYRPVLGPLRDLLMWFDDDSYVSAEPEAWLSKTLDTMKTYDAMGQYWSISLRGNQSQYIEDAPWYRGKPVPRTHRVRFLQGGWWLVRTSKLLENDWPTPDIVRKGGDVMLGELMRQQGWRVFDVGRDYGVQINANNPSGNHSVGPTRGPMPLPDPVGTHYRRKVSNGTG